MPNNPVFEWDGGHPALDFVNTLDERLSGSPVDRLVNYSALVSFSQQAKLIGRNTASLLAPKAGGAAGARVLSDAILFREAAYRTLIATSSRIRPSPTDIQTINATLSVALSHRRLTISAAGANQAWDDMTHIERPLWEVARCFEDLLSNWPFYRVRKCHARDCGVVFIDRSKAGRRRWCSMANCGNRAKMRQFRARLAHMP